ncbi:MAG: hypothetical protein ACPHK8_01290 [Thermoplasmatota archaeon]
MIRAVAIILALLMVSTIPTSAQGDKEYVLVIDCPDGGGFQCPIRAEDGEDMMGDPSLAVDPFDTDRIIMASLHGTGDGNGPDAKSRQGQAFTTFTSTNHGASWTDNPFTPPPNLGFGAYGIHPQVTIDPFGFVYIGSLYAVEDGQGGFDYVIAAQNFSGISNINSAQNGVYNVKFIPSLEPKNEIKQFWYLYHPAEDIMNMVWWEAPREQGTQGQNQGVQLPNPRLAGLDMMPRGTSEGAETTQQSNETSGAIGIVWKDRRDYYGQDPDEVIKPCDSATNPVRSDGFLYVGCRVGEGHFKWGNVEPGTFVVFRMRPDTSELTYLGPTPLQGGEAKLGARSDGRLALASAVIKNEKLELYVAYGSYENGRVKWSNLDSFGNDIEPQRGTRRITEANVQQLIYREYSGAVHLILKQVSVRDGVGTESLVGIADPNIKKSIIAIHEDYGLLADMDLDVGNPLNRTDPALLAATEDVYNDLSDAFLQMPEAPYTYRGEDLGMYSREFIGIGDYGIVTFAEVIEITEIRFPGGPPPPAPPVPLPAPAASLTVTQVLVPAAGITIAGLMAASFAINRSTSHNAATAKGKK